MACSSSFSKSWRYRSGSFFELARNFKSARPCAIFCPTSEAPRTWKSIISRTMNADAIFSKPRVVFWSTIGSDPYEENPVPGWLQGWWEVYDGNYYYYYFNDENVVTYTTAKPANTSMPPYKMPMNEGDVTVSGDETEIIIDWNPADGGETQEIFTKRSPTTMNGTSNRYAPLFATKI